MAKVRSIVGVRLQRAGRVYYFDPRDIELEVNDYVVVETEQGLRLGRVVIAPKQVIASELTQLLKSVLRKASPEDFQHREAAQQREKEALSKCKELIAKLNLPMKPLSAEADLDGTHLIIFFSAEGRVDFRQLVQELATALKARVELRQVGPRDAAKLIGGVGRCGCTLCCATFLTEFNPLSIRMAKEQSLTLDPAKISGVCGRLLCCLGYESELYRNVRQKMPLVGQQVSTPLGQASVVEVNLLKETLTVKLESQAVVELPLTDIGKRHSAKRA